MKKMNGWETVAMLVAALAVMTISAGCERRKEDSDEGKNKTAQGGGAHANPGARDLARVDCSAHTDFSIKVDATDDVLVDPNETVIIVCTGDTVKWVAQNPAFKVSVAIDGEHAEELFGKGNTIFATNSGTGQTAVQTVQKPKKHGLVHKYSIEVLDQANITHRVDPHVIPMGN